MPQNSVEFISFCWKLSSGHLNARAEGSRKGGKEEARILSPPCLSPTASGGAVRRWRGRGDRAGEGGARRRKKKKEEHAFFVLPSLAPTTMIQSLLEERGERKEGIFSRCCHDSTLFPAISAPNIRWKTKCRLYPTTLHIRRRLLLFLGGDITQAGEKVLFLFLCGACVYVCRKGEEKEEILLRRRKKKDLGT